MVRKLVFLGPAEAGKTSMRKFLFEGVRARDLLDNPEPPSIGLKYSKYDYMLSAPVQTSEASTIEPEKILVDLSLVDSAGQEIDRWVIDSRDHVFPEADVVFFFFDVSEWEDPARQMYIKDFLSFVDDARMALAPDSEFHVIAHKCDKVVDTLDKVGDLEQRIRTGLREYLFEKKGLMLDYKVQATSIVKPFRDMTHARFVEIVAGDLPEFG